MGDEADNRGLYVKEIGAPNPSRVLMSQNSGNNISSDAYNNTDEETSQKKADAAASDSNENLDNSPLIQPDMDSIKKLEEHHFAIKKINITNIILGIVFLILIGVLLGVIYLWK